MSTGTPSLHGAIGFDLVGGDVWAWEKRLAGSAPKVPPDAKIEVRVNGTSFPVQRTGERFVAAVLLEPGENEAIAVALLTDGDQIASRSVTFTVRMSPRPTAHVDLGVEGGAVILDSGASVPSELDGSPIVSRQWTVRPGNPAGISALETAAATMPVTLSVPAPAGDGEYYVSLEVTDAKGRTDASAVRFVVEGGVPRVVDPLREEATWIDRAVVYGMVVRNFTSEGFRGVTARLEDLQRLGITAIWLAPITGTPEGDFGYAVTDYFGVRPEYGSLEDLRTLVDRAHAHCIRVLMDFVPNHTSTQHPYFIDAETCGEASPYWEFYARDADGAPTHYFDWSHLPNLNFDHPEVRRFMTEALAFWVRDYDIDGFRVDVAWGIKERRPDYWLDWSAQLHRIKPDIFLIAEASARDPFYVHNGFHAAYDWTDELGVWAWGEALASRLPLSTVMAAALTNHNEGYDPDTLILRFLNNNDTGNRFVSVHGVGRYRVALAMLMTLPGVPCIYTGDEVGAEFRPYETAGEISWADPNQLRPFVKRLIHLRKSNPSLYSREWIQLDVDPSVACFGYVRHAEKHAPIAVILNDSPDDLDARFTLPAGLSGSTLVDLWTGDATKGHPPGALTVPVPAWGFRILKVHDAA